MTTDPRSFSRQILEWYIYSIFLVFRGCNGCGKQEEHGFNEGGHRVRFLEGFVNIYSSSHMTNATNDVIKHSCFPRSDLFFELFLFLACRPTRVWVQRYVLETAFPSGRELDHGQQGLPRVLRLSRDPPRSVHLA